MQILFRINIKKKGKWPVRDNQIFQSDCSLIVFGPIILRRGIPIFRNFIQVEMRGHLPFIKFNTDSFFEIGMLCF